MKSLFALAICFSAMLIVLSACTSTSNEEGIELKDRKLTFEVSKSEGEWKRTLTPEQFRVLRKKGTEPAFTGKYHDNKKEGLYVCAGCGNELFHSDAKFDSGTGWPSFWTPISEKSVVTQADNSFFMRRTEVLCNRCGGHLGHVFNDGPPPTGLRYCINSLSLDFDEGKENPYAKTGE
jgi:peptide-methionine (R)-S-oxide reductase